MPVSLTAAPVGLTAVPVGGGRAWLRCPWAAAGPGCGARGRWRGLAGLRDNEPSPSAHQAPLVWRAPEGPEGTGGLRDRPLRAFRLACGDLAGGRARRRPEHQRCHVQKTRTPGYAKGAGTEVPAPHSAIASSRLRPIDRQSWRRRRIHRNMPPTTAAPRPAPPIRPSKPVRARR